MSKQVSVDYDWHGWVCLTRDFLHHIHHAQDDTTVALGRLYLLTVVLVLWSELTHGMLLGGHRYLAANAVRFATENAVCSSRFSSGTASDGRFAWITLGSLLAAGGTWFIAVRR